MKILQNKTSALSAGVLLSTFALLGVGCSSSLHPSNTQVTQATKTTQTMNNAQVEILQVAPYKESCVGAFPMECLLVNGSYFYSDIEGFEFEDGYNYTLKVAKTQRCNPAVLNDCPQDVGIYKYSLLEVLKKEKAPDFNQLKWTDNSPKLNSYMQEYFKQQQIQGNYKAAAIDLNADGNNEYIVMLESGELCGTGGCQVLILQATDDNSIAQSFTVISENGEMTGPVQDVAVVQQQANNNDSNKDTNMAKQWRKLYFLYSDGGSLETYVKAEYIEGFYITQAIENE